MFERVADNDPIVAELSRKAQIEGMAHMYMREHGLLDKGWSFGWDAPIGRFGQCNYTRKEITISERFISESDEEIIDVILHEIAHAIVGKKAGHGWEWKHQCRIIGARPERLYESLETKPPPPNYVMKCPSCDRKWYRYRMRKRNFGSRCPDCQVQVKIYRINRKESNA